MMKYKKASTLLLTCGLILSAWMNQGVASQTTPLKNERDKLSYSLGVITGQAFKMHKIDIEPTLFALGFSDAIGNKPTLLTESEIKETVQRFQAQSQLKAAEKTKTQAAENLQAGQAFLQDNKNQSGVVTLPSGLQYRVVKAAQGAKPTVTDTVVVDYAGRLINGKVFDSSYKRGKPAIFQVGEVIKGWQQALVLMNVGAIWELYVPADLAYGSANVPNIGPNQVLIFKVHLLSIKK